MTSNVTALSDRNLSLPENFAAVLASRMVRHELGETPRNQAILDRMRPKWKALQARNPMAPFRFLEFAQFLTRCEKTRRRFAVHAEREAGILAEAGNV